MEVLLVLALVAAVTAVLINVFFETRGAVNSTQAITELNTIIESARRYRRTFAAAGSYTGISVDELTDNNYPVGGIDRRGNQNIFEEVVTLVASGSTPGSDATLTYPTSSEEACSGLRRLFSDGTETVQGINSATCGGTGSDDLIIVIN